MYNTDLPTRAELPSSGQLLRSTLTALLIAAALLVTTILPAEYGIDPTGIGRTLGLTQMGEIKASLANEAQAKAATPAPLSAAQPPDAHTQTAAPVPATSTAPMEAKAPPARQHTVTLKLKPGEGAEIKLTMDKGATVDYEWTVAGGTVNYDTHGDPENAPKDFYHGYGKGRSKAADAGTLKAAFNGKHGWFWRNRSATEVTVTLKTNGDYGQIERLL